MVVSQVEVIVGCSDDEVGEMVNPAVSRREWQVRGTFWAIREGGGPGRRKSRARQWFLAEMAARPIYEKERAWEGWPPDSRLSGLIGGRRALATGRRVLLQKGVQPENSGRKK